MISEDTRLEYMCERLFFAQAGPYGWMIPKKTVTFRFRRPIDRAAEVCTVSWEATLPGSLETGYKPILKSQTMDVHLVPSIHDSEMEFARVRYAVEALASSCIDALIRHQVEPFYNLQAHKAFKETVNNVLASPPWVLFKYGFRSLFRKLRWHK